MCSLSYRTYKPEVSLASDLSTRSEQKLMEESGGVYCSLCNVYHGVYCQTMSPGKDMYKFNNTSLHQEKYQKYERGRGYIQLFICRAFYMYVYDMNFSDIYPLPSVSSHNSTEEARYM